MRNVSAWGGGGMSISVGSVAMPLSFSVFSGMVISAILSLMVKKISSFMTVCLHIAHACPLREGRGPLDRPSTDLQTNYEL